MGVPPYLQPDLEADLVLPPAPASRVDNHYNSKNTRSDRNVVKGAWAARIQRNKMECFTQEIRLFFLYFGEVVLHDADPSRRAFIHSCLSRNQKNRF
ncbi:unnamed protein product [Camellia sinensis]